VPNSSHARCITISRDRGTYEYLLVVKVNGQEVDRCSDVVNVGGATGGVGSCTITGPTQIESGGSAELCGNASVLHSISWSGPNGFTANTACITVYEGGTYTFTTRNPLTGSVRTAHRCGLEHF
jgi:hypothetical protein